MENYKVGITILLVVWW